MGRQLSVEEAVGNIDTSFMGMAYEATNVSAGTCDCGRDAHVVNIQCVCIISKSHQSRGVKGTADAACDNKVAEGGVACILEGCSVIFIGCYIQVERMAIAVENTAEPGISSAHGAGDGDVVIENGVHIAVALGRIYFADEGLPVSSVANDEKLCAADSDGGGEGLVVVVEVALTVDEL